MKGGEIIKKRIISEHRVLTKVHMTGELMRRSASWLSINIQTVQNEPTMRNSLSSLVIEMGSDDQNLSSESGSLQVAMEMNGYGLWKRY